MNAVVVRNSLQEQRERGGEIRRDLYVMNINKRRNFHNCEGFGYIIKYFRSQKIVGQKRMIEYRNNYNHRDNLKKKKSLVVLDYILITSSIY